jgi:hypothetical protein
MRVITWRKIVANRAVRSVVVAPFVLFLFTVLPADDGADTRSVQQLAEAIAKLEAQIAELQEELSALRDEEKPPEVAEADELDDLRREAEAAAGEPKPEDEAPQKPAVGRQRALQALNPEISYLGDFSWDWTDSEIDDQFVLRGAEIGFQSTLDPYTRFKGFLSAHQELPELEDPALVHEEDLEEEEAHGHAHDSEINVTLEESYIEWVALPLKSRLRVGKFRQQYGTLNRWHPHALPSTDVPFALRNLFGHEGLIGLGVGYDLPLPKLWASANGLTLEVVNPDNDSAFLGGSFGDPVVLLRHTGFFDLGPDTYFDLNLNWMNGPNDREDDSRTTTIYGTDFNFVWEPVNRAKYRGLELRGEYIVSRFDEEDGSTVDSQSFYTYLTWKLNRRWIVGFRYDNAELPWDRFELFDGVPFREGLRETAWTPFLTFWQSEFVRLRLQYQNATRDFDFPQGDGDEERVWLQVTFAAGPHKHEAY